MSKTDHALNAQEQRARAPEVSADCVRNRSESDNEVNASLYGRSESKTSLENGKRTQIGEHQTGLIQESACELVASLGDVVTSDQKIALYP